MKKHRLFFGFVIGAAVGLAGETLVLVQRQCDRVEESLRDDFRVVLFVKPDLEEGRRQVLEEQLRALPDVESVEAVSKDEAWENLRRDEPELVEAVSFLNENPLLPAFQVKLDEAGLGSLPRWLSQAEALSDWADVRYKPGQAQAVLQAAFYARLLAVALSGLICLTAALALAGLWTATSPARVHWRDWSGALLAHPAAAAAAALGGAAGAGGAALIALPLRAGLFGLAWPSLGAQAAVVLAAGAAGWSLCGLRD